MEVNFEMLAERSKMQILRIVKNDVILGKGIYIPKALTSFKDDEKSIISFSDTGVFVLFQGSNAFSKEEKYKKYIDESNKTTREIIFQSKNAAAKFVLGEKGSTNNWRI